LGLCSIPCFDELPNPIWASPLAKHDTQQTTPEFDLFAFGFDALYPVLTAKIEMCLAAHIPAFWCPWTELLEIALLAYNPAPPFPQPALNLVRGRATRGNNFDRAIWQD
jgi:hypothetical protein